MSIDSQETKVTVQVNIKGYQSVRALKTICVIGRENIQWKLYSKEQRYKMDELIEAVLELP